MGKLPLTAANLTGLVAWETGEGGGFGNEAENNPLNTTLPYARSWPINYANVQSYATEQDGLMATWETLTNGDYGVVLSCLANSAPPAGLAEAIGSTPWGTPAALVLECIDGAASAVSRYFTMEVAMLFIKEPNGQVYWFIPAGPASYWRLVPPKAAGMLPASWLVPDDGSWLALWRIG